MNNRKILKYHSLAGLIAGIFLVLMGLSGAILVFQHDIEEYQWKEYIEVENYSGLNIDRGIKETQKEYPGWDTRLMHFEEQEALIFNLRKPTERLFIFVHPSTGEVIKEINELTTFTRWLLKFHYSFQVGPAGRILVFIIGIIFLFSLLTGIYLYRKSVLKTITCSTRLNLKTRRTLYSSLHRIVGTWALLFNLLLVVTGIFLAWTVAASGLNPPAAPQTPAVNAPVGKLLAQISSEYPDFTPTYIRLPLKPDAELSVYGLFDDDAFFYSEFYNSIRADHRSGEITGVTRVQEADLITKFSSSLIPLHFGQYGGIWTKILYCLIGLSGPFLSITGFLIWWQGKPAKKLKQKKKFHYL
ncbi:PepSY-associated TM helix domain-containing protein [Salinimicrobium sp. TH3]|uniref:PepSY-associated TM helix domain-containing protein n=1 Tax=Salinimicrobium sp. TH3 TaxID=2997342 RepID=UPI00227369DA|nr:PepSY-associated TM helix domain-containing protein [Salinimicrobium sp. TH3]MCY2686111.1 PepSY-associated TM helix domain-containing protein [Salinimicrobium sp. TH3]